MDDIDYNASLNQATEDSALLKKDSSEKKPFNWADAQPPKFCTFLPFDPYPWFVLASICFLTFGSYWVFDTPGAIQTQLTQWMTCADGKACDVNSHSSQEAYPNRYNNLRNLALYSIYSWPNIFLAFFGGYIIDRFTGVRLGALIFCGLVMLGQFIFAVGIQFKLYYLMLFGRFVFGLGGESLTVAQNTFTARWFDGDTLALAFGITVSFSRIGSSINFVATPPLTKISVPFAVWFGFGTTCISLTACLVAGFLDWFGQKKIAPEKLNSGEAPPSLLHVRHFPLTAWLLMIITTIFYIAVLVFFQVASVIMQHTGRHYTPGVASSFIAIPNIVSIFASPGFGYLIDKTGRSLIYVFVASLGLTLGHLGFIFNATRSCPGSGDASSMSYDCFQIHPAILMTWVGISYSMGAASLWPGVAHIIHSKMVGTAYGTMTSLQNLGLAVAPLIIGAIQQSFSDDDNRRYTVPLVIFMGCAIVSALLALATIIADKRTSDGRLNGTPAYRHSLPPLLSNEDRVAAKLQAEGF